jgi:hypothetical protein
MHASTLLFGCVVGLNDLTGVNPVVKLYQGMQNIPPPPSPLLWPNPPAYTNTVKELPAAATAADCQQACVGYRNKDASNVSGWTRCKIFTWLPPNSTSSTSGSRGRCVAVVDGEWRPLAQDGAVSGRLTWASAPCRADSDCSYNGVCTNNLCVCQRAWKDDRCQTLALLPTTRRAGLRATDGGKNTSSWGGSVLLDNKTGLMHMWASEMEAHCGISSWTTNSHIVKAVSAEPYGRVFERVSASKGREVWPAFSHEVNVVRAPTGEWVAYFSAIAETEPGPICSVCTDGNTPKGAIPSKCARAHELLATFMSFAHSPDGPWSAPARLFPTHTGVDTNLAVVILANGSVVGLARTSASAPLVISVHSVTAHDWRDPASYVGDWNTTLFPGTGCFVTPHPPHTHRPTEIRSHI